VPKKIIPLSKSHPSLSKEAFGWDPTQISKGSHKKVNWICKNNKKHKWIASIYSRSRGTGCPYCSGRRAEVGKNDLLSRSPKLFKEINDKKNDLKEISVSSGKILEWKCSKNHIWKARVADRTKGKGCPYCSNRKILEGFNDLNTTDPDLAKEAFGWNPKDYSRGNGKILSWKCYKGHIWKISINKRTSFKTKTTAYSGCPFCSHQKLLSGFNDMATTHPEIAKHAFGFDPSKVFANSHTKLKWRCNLGHVFYSGGDYISQNVDFQCPICNGKRLLIGFNDLQSKFPDIASQADGWNPKNYISGSNKKVKWKCENGHKWSVGINQRTSIHKTGCPSCAKYGFDPNKEAFFYFLIQPVWEMYQIGITNFHVERIKSHNKNGFELLELRGPMDGHTAQELETLTLRFLKSQKADLSPEHVAGKFDGYSESWTIDSYKVNNLKELIDKASEAGY
jgi:DNA-directed RNA polymerase subunit RPC12/RpoP